MARLLPEGTAAVSLLNVLLHCTAAEQEAMTAEVVHARQLAHKGKAYTGPQGAPLPWTTAEWSALATHAPHLAKWL
jgi:hypothetical protein